MVGTSATVACFLPRKLLTARRNAGTVRTIMGPGDISARSFGAGRPQLQPGRGGDRHYQGRCWVAKQIGCVIRVEQLAEPPPSPKDSWLRHTGSHLRGSARISLDRWRTQI